MAKKLNGSSLRNTLAKSFIITLFFLFILNQMFAQNNNDVLVQDSVLLDTTFTKKAVVANSKKIDIALSFAIPSTLITYGIITRFSPQLQKFDHNIDDRINQIMHRKYKFDDYIQYAPYVAVFGLDLCRVRAKHSFVERTLVTGTSVLIMCASVTITKRLTKIQRPDKSNYHSFPSGHTATAFLGAHILLREYKDVSPWIGVAGYAVAFTTGAMRMINRKHWFSDVLTGAGVAILSAELSYLMLPVWRKCFKIKSRQNRNGLAIITPLVSQNHFGIAGMYIF
jgi:membrane-associated phospholipid phosphatase